MKKRFLVFIIAAVLALGLVGSCLALYKKDATPKNVSLSAGDAVTLGINTTASFDLKELSPDKNETLEVTLTASGVAKAEEGKVGLFTVKITPNSNSSTTDAALAQAIRVAASGDFTADHATLTGAGQDLGAIKDYTAKTITLTFSLPGVNQNAFLAISEGKVDIEIDWKIVDPFTPTSSSYYLIKSSNNWTVNRGTVVLGAGDGDNDAIKTNIALAVGDEFKIVTGVTKVGSQVGEAGVTWYDCKGGYAIGSGDVSKDSDQNAVVNVAGAYNIYLKTAEGFYVSPYEAPKGGDTLTIDVSGVSWFEGDSCVPYLYIWYENGTNSCSDSSFGVALEKEGNVYKYTDTNSANSGKAIAGIVISRGKVVEGTAVRYNYTDAIYNLSITKTITIVEDTSAGYGAKQNLKVAV